MPAIWDAQGGHEMKCPECGKEIVCVNCQAFCQTKNIDLQCGIAVQMYVLDGREWGFGYCSEYYCKCGHEEKVDGG